MVVVKFRFRLKPDANPEVLGSLFEQMVGLVSQMPGYLSVNSFAAEDGQMAVIAEFDSVEAVDAWREHRSI